MEVKRLFDVLEYQRTNYPQANAINCKKNGVWENHSTEEIVNIVNKLSLGLLNLGIRKGDKVAIISDSRPEWAFTDLAMQQIGVITVPLYPNSTEQDYAFICHDAEVKYIFISDELIYKKLKSIEDKIPSVIDIYSFDKIENKKHWTVLTDNPSTEHQELLDQYKNEIDENELATIIYTSGTTGKPKGVMLSHKNIISNAKGVKNAFEIVDQKYTVLCFLPLCHIFARTELYTYLYLGVSIYYAESIETIGQNLKEVKPQFFATVPRLLEKIYDKIITKGYELKGLKRSLFFWSVKLANQYDPEKNMGGWYRWQLGIANKLIFSKWREAVGGNIEFIISGAAALQPRLQRIFWAAGIHVIQGYGQTETSPGVALGRPAKNVLKVGCIGEIMQDIEVKFAEDGEILVKGPNVMMGYYKRPDATAETINADGWLHTGDIGEMVEGKYLKITDRKKEIFKTSGGKYIAPQEIENILKESLFIEHVMVVGEGQKFAGALIIPNFEAARDWCKLHHIDYTSDQEMAQHPKLVAKINKEIERLNESLAQYKKIKKSHILGETWTIESGEFTPTLKLRRKVIKENCQKHIDEFYK